MYDGQTRATALDAMAAGESLNSISRRLGMSRSALRDWRDRASGTAHPADCPQCADGAPPSSPYALLLGLYLGDGCLSEHKKGVFALRIVCDDAYPGLIDETARVMAVVNPSRPVHRVQAVGYTSVVSYWKHWPCLFPQHGPGHNHERTIELAEWQQEIVAEYPEPFLRELPLGRPSRGGWAARSFIGPKA